MATCSFCTVMLLLATRTSISCAKEANDFQEQTSVDQSMTHIQTVHHRDQYFTTFLDDEMMKGLTPKLMDHVDCKALTYQRPSVLSVWSREEFMHSVLVLVAFLALLRSIKPIGVSQDLRGTFLLELVVFLCPCPSANGVLTSFQQIAPNNSLICPGQRLVYSCTTDSTGFLGWQINGQIPVTFTNTDPVNLTNTQKPFIFILNDVIMDGPILISTATAEIADSSLDGTEIECDDGINPPSSLYVDVADGPANCSNVTVHCEVIYVDNLETSLRVQVSANNELMCAVGYLVQFNGENKTVPIRTASINFTIDREGEKYSLEGKINTVDNESRIGQIPCFFGIPGPSAVENVKVQNCSTGYVLIAWMSSVISGCLIGDTRLEYRIEFSFGEEIFFDIKSDTSVELPLRSDLQVTDLVVNITPVIPDLQLTGTPLSTNLNKVVAACLEPTTPSTTVSAKGSDNTDIVNALGGIIGVLLLLLLVLLIVLVVKFILPHFQKNKGIQPNTPGQPNEDAENAEGIQPNTPGQPNEDAENAEEEQDDSEPKKRKDGYQRLSTQEPKEIFLKAPKEPSKQTKKVEARTPGGLQELRIFRRHSPELRVALIKMETPKNIAVALCANRLLLTDTLEKLEELKKHDERAKLLFHDIENKIAVSKAGQDFLILCEILYKYQELREISTKMIQDYEKERGSETCFRFPNEPVSGIAMETLENHYAENNSPSTLNKQKIADELRLHYASVSDWFKSDRSTGIYRVEEVSLPEAEQQEDPHSELVTSAPRTVKDEGVKVKSTSRRHPSFKHEDVCFRVSHSKDAEDDQDDTNWVIFTEEKHRDRASCPSETTLKEDTKM